jgi:hypothetical protein
MTLWWLLLLKNAGFTRTAVVLGRACARFVWS